MSRSKMKRSTMYGPFTKCEGPLRHWNSIFEVCEICKFRRIRTEARYEARIGLKYRFMCPDHFELYGDKSVDFVEV